MPNDKPRILIIDNDEGLVFALSVRLENDGYVCRSAITGSQGIAEFTDFRPDLVITDLNMGCGDGVEVVKAIRGKGNVPIVVMTGFKQAFRNRLDGFTGISVIQKPCDFQTLRDVIETELALSDSGATSCETHATQGR